MRRPQLPPEAYPFQIAMAAVFLFVWFVVMPVLLFVYGGRY